MSDDRSGPSSVRRSVAEAGEVAAEPTDGEAIFIKEVTDEEGAPAGLLIEWLHENTDQWLWADRGSYEPLTQ